MPHRSRTIATIAVAGAIAGVSVPALASPATPAAPVATRHVLVALRSPVPAIGAGQTAALSLLAPLASTVSTATSLVRGLGLSATPSADGATLDVSGPATLVDAAFGAEGHLGQLSTGPLAAVATGVLDPDDTSKVFSTRIGGFTAQQLATDYGATHATTGIPTPAVATRPIVATIQLSKWNPASLTTFASANHLYADTSFDPVKSGLYADRPVSQRYPGTGTNCQTGKDSNGQPLLDYTGEEEVILDQEAVLGVAPSLRQRSYTAANTGSCIYSAYQSVLDDVKAGQPIVALSTSWGSCENFLTDNGKDASFINAIEGILTKLTAAGVTITAATGDNGRYDCTTDSGAVDTSYRGSDYPASSPSVLGVGGTHHVTGSLDTAWNNGSSATRYGGSGGGFSGVDITGGTAFRGFAKPSWQQGATTAGVSTREVPDLSFDGDPQTGLTVWAQGDVCTGNHLPSPCSGAYGGTSLSAPLVAGLISQLVADHAGATVARGKGLIQPAIYAHRAEVFTDVVNQEDAGNSILFGVGPGYDESTGLGVPNLTALSSVLFAPAPGISAPASSSSATIPVAVTAPAGISGVAAWYVSGTDNGCSGAGSPTPPSSLTLPDGVYLVTARVLTTDARCSDAGTVRVVVATKRPSVTISSWKRADATSTKLTAKFVVKPSAAGVSSVSYVVRESSNHKAVSAGNLSGSAKQLTFKGRAGVRYDLTIVAADTFGPGSTAKAGSTLPLDDRSSKRKGAWTRVATKGAYLSTVTRTGSAGATISASVTGSTVGVLVVRQPDGGRAALVVDGRVKKTIDLSATSKKFNQSYTVKVKSGKHTVTLRALGQRGSVGRGTTVTLDGFVSG